MTMISSVSGQGWSNMQGMQLPDPAQMAEDLFSKIDTSGQGYIEKSDLETAFSELSSDTDVDALFSQLDTDGDGKVTQSEFTSTLQQLDAQMVQMQVQQGMGSMPPPPPPGGQGGDEGFTQDELESQLAEISDSDSDSDSNRATLISSIVDNFDEADSDGDGKVNFDEAMSYAEANGISVDEPVQQAGAMPPPPPPGGPQAGGSQSFSVEELQAQLEAIGDTDSTRSTLISSIIDNFDEVDTDGDGMVSDEEAMAYGKANGLGPDSESVASTSSVSSDTALKIMELMRAYGLGIENESSLSVSA